jgi:transposase
LPQLKLMAAAAEPTGMLVASEVHPGDAADDPLYLPLIRRVRELLGRTGLLYTGDCKMAALETRGEIDAHRGFLLDASAHDGRDPRESPENSLGMIRVFCSTPLRCGFGFESWSRGGDGRKFSRTR